MIDEGDSDGEGTRLVEPERLAGGFILLVPRAYPRL